MTQDDPVTRKKALKEQREKKKEKNQQKKENYHEDPSNLNNICRDFMKNRENPDKPGCQRERCRFIHDSKLCTRYWQNGGSCKFKHNCRKNHFVIGGSDSRDRDRRGDHPVREPVQDRRGDHPVQGYSRDRRGDHHVREPVQDRRGNHPVQSYSRDRRGDHHVQDRRGDDLTSKFVDMNILILNANANGNFPKKINEKDIVILKGLFDNKPSLFKDLCEQLKGVKEEVFQLWHNDCHRIANDRANWRDRVPIFEETIEQMKNYFGVDVQATRLNTFKDTDFKYYHRDRAAFHEETALKQNFTICLNLGAERTIAFRNVKTKTIISVPLKNGDVYCFAKKINEEWEHAVLKEQRNHVLEERLDITRISVVIWGKLIRE
jgi:hypothetical protein